MLNLIKEREAFVKTINHDRFPTNAPESYYEIIKELATALMVLDGLKAIGESAHKEMIDYLRSYEEFSEGDIIFVNDLRLKRNNSYYEGKKFNLSYITNNKGKISNIIRRLESTVNKRIKS